MGEDEQTEQGGGFQGAVPLLASVAAGAAAGAIAVVARKALSGDGGGESEGDEASEASDREEDRGTAFEDIGQVADDLAGLVDQLRAEAESDPDFRRLVELADAISEYADQAANAFEASAGSDDEGDGSERRVTDDLMGRIGELTGGEREKAESGSRRAERERARS
jgi:hypothetical protein